MLVYIVAIGFPQGTGNRMDLVLGDQLALGFRGRHYQNDLGVDVLDKFAPRYYPGAAHPVICIVVPKDPCPFLYRDVWGVIT